MNHQELTDKDIKPPRRILRLREVERLTGYKSSSIYRMVKEGVFPGKGGSVRALSAGIVGKSMLG